MTAGAGTDPIPFDLAAPLPSGLFALEASAGTGKTYALSALAVRAVAEGCATAGQLCIVSFTEAATAELRGRVRAGLVAAAELIGSVRRGAVGLPERSTDPLARALTDVDDLAELSVREQRLRTAIAEFDAATISTIHGFCHRIVASSTAAGEAATIVSGDRDVAEAVNDVVLADPQDPVRIPADALAATVGAMLSMPDAELFVGDPPTAGRPEQRAAIDAAAQRARAAHELVLERRRTARRRTFDSMIADARALVCGPSGHEVVAGLRERYRMILVDEFQDTDRVQWDIFRTAFIDPSPGVALDSAPPTVIVVGDPKQSIYRFRSAELAAYLDAIQMAGTQVGTLATNWRSDGPLLAGFERLFTGFTFGDPSVVFRPVDAAPHLIAPRLDGVDGAPLEIRCLDTDADGELTTPAARRTIGHDVVGVVIEHLEGAGTLPDTDRRRPIRPRDIAVLTRSNAEALSVAAALGAAGVPAATGSSDSVLDSRAASQWTVLLCALERPGMPGLARAAALGWFLGLTPAQVDDLDDDGLAELLDEVRAWAEDLRRDGIPAILARARAGGLHERVLASPSGERDLTDLDHVAELLQTVTDGRVEGPSTLLDALVRLADAAGADVAAADRLARRIDRDDDAVTVLTVHKAKGLQFPIVLCPYLWSSSPARGIPHAHLDGRHLLDAVWTSKIDSSAKALIPVKEASKVEDSGEARRLLYVALTRAQHRCVVWWPPVTSRRSTSPLASLLDHALQPEPVSADALEVLAEASAGTIGLCRVGAATTRPHPRRVPETEPGPVTLEVATTSRTLDTSWRIWSFTSMSALAGIRRDRTGIPDAAAHAASIERVEVVRGAGEDETVPGRPEAAEAPSSVSGPVSVPTSLAAAPAGPEFGTVVHGILERSDFAAPDLADHLRAECASSLAHVPVNIDPARLATGLAAAIEAPLGGPLGATRLRDISCADRLDEMEFHLPLGTVRADEIGRVLDRHLSAEDPLRPWASSLADHGFDLDLAGLLTGSIDLVFRADDRYWVSDYKTNQLDRSGTADRYSPALLVDAMVHHHYPMQAVLYLVALHRYLRWRRHDYRVADHLGGVAYLFLRGMDPNLEPERARGVFWWRPPAAAVEALDRLLAGGSR